MNEEKIILLRQVKGRINMSCSRRCLECPFYIENAKRLREKDPTDWHLDEACYGMTPDGQKTRKAQS